MHKINTAAAAAAAAALLPPNTPWSGWFISLLAQLATNRQVLVLDLLDPLTGLPTAAVLQPAGPTIAIMMLLSASRLEPLTSTLRAWLGAGVASRPAVAMQVSGRAAEGTPAVAAFPEAAGLPQCLCGRTQPSVDGHRHATVTFSSSCYPKRAFAWICFAGAFGCFRTCFQHFRICRAKMKVFSALLLTSDPADAGASPECIYWPHINTMVARLPNQALFFKCSSFIETHSCVECVFLVDISTAYLPTYIWVLGGALPASLFTF